MQWNCDEASCWAGFFHSIYGTNAFHYAVIALELRNQLRELIGMEAEILVYHFCSADRPGSWLSALHTGGYVSRITDQFINLDALTLARLIEVECANLIEQRSGKKFITALCQEIDIFPLPLNARLRSVIRQHASDCVSEKKGHRSAPV